MHSRYVIEYIPLHGDGLAWLVEEKEGAWDGETGGWDGYVTRRRICNTLRRNEHRMLWIDSTCSQPASSIDDFHLRLIGCRSTDYDFRP